MEEKRRLRMIHKDLIYEVLSGFLGTELPWGSLTGVRPTKLPYQWYEAGCSREEAEERLRREYRVSEEKAKMACEIAATERELFSAVRAKYQEGSR